MEGAHQALVGRGVVEGEGSGARQFSPSFPARIRAHLACIMYFPTHAKISFLLAPESQQNIPCDAASPRPPAATVAAACSGCAAGAPALHQHYTRLTGRNHFSRMAVVILRELNFTKHPTIANICEKRCGRRRLAPRSQRQRTCDAAAES